MDELTLLRTLRDDVTEPSDEQLAPARARLEAAMRGEVRRARPARARWVLAVAGGAVVLALVGGNLHMTAQSAQAAAVLRAVAADSSTFADATPGPGQYVLSHTRANWAVIAVDESGVDSARMNIQTLDVYVPYDPADDWVLDRDWGDVAPGGREIIRARDGEFYGGPWLSQDLDKLPRGGQELLTYFDSQYVGGSASRDEDNFVRIVDLLRSGLVPADLRAGLYEALALIPGVNTTDSVENLDGKVGVAIGRTEWLRGGSRQEIIIDPATGLVIGERQIFSVAAFGFGVNNVTQLTAVETTVVDVAP